MSTLATHNTRVGATHLALVRLRKLESLDEANGFGHAASNLVVVDLDATNDALRINHEQATGGSRGGM